MIRGVVYGAISLATISSIACAEDLATATTPLAPGTFTTSVHSDEWKIANALSAGPALGTIYVLAGLIALYSVVAATVARVFVVGIMMLIAGVAEVINA